MGMSAWGIFAAPFLMQAAPVDQSTVEIAQPQTNQSTDIFGSITPLDELAMSEASGGADTAIDIQDFGVNLAENDGGVSNIDVDNSETGQIANNAVNGNRGITTVFNNTGNGVVFQSNVNVNIFLNGDIGN